MALTPSELDLIERLKAELDRYALEDERNLRYYRGLQRVEQLGMAIPPTMRRFLVVVNWPRVVVDTIEHRQNVRSLILPGEETADPTLRLIWDASNLSAHVKMFNRDRMIYGRAFMSVGSNEANASLPLVRVESPREMAAFVDARREVVTSAARFYGVDPRTGAGPTQVTLYLPDQTVWVARSEHDGRWYEVDRDVHRLGAVPVVMHLNRRMSSGWVGESQMSDIIPLTDSAARTLTNLQFAIEAHGIPKLWTIGAKQGDFINADGTPIPQWEAYFDAIHFLTDPAAKVGQTQRRRRLKNFESAVNLYGKQAATVTGFPARYFGLHTTNPPAEGAIRADEAQLVESVEGAERRSGHDARLGGRPRSALLHWTLGGGQPGPRRLARPGDPDDRAADGRGREGGPVRHPVPRGLLGRARLVRGAQGQGARLLLRAGSRPGHSGHRERGQPCRRYRQRRGVTTGSRGSSAGGRSPRHARRAARAPVRSPPLSRPIRSRRPRPPSRRSRTCCGSRRSPRGPRRS